VNPPEYGDALRDLHDLAPADVTDTISRVARRSGASDVQAYLVDFEQTMLFPVPDRSGRSALPVGHPVEGTPLGRAFTERRLTGEPVEGGTRVWVPILEGSECTGVLALTLTGEVDDGARARCEELGMLAGAVIAVAARTTDFFHLVRRRRSMSLPASMQWDLLPPLHLTTPEATSTGLLEPAYDVGGDCFDHAVNGFTLDLAVMDAMGHGLGSSVVSSLALGSYRHDRREGQPLRIIHDRLDAVVAERFRGDAFVTGQLARLDLGSGRLTWVNAGHPPPLLVRRGKVVRSLVCAPSLPWGLGGRLAELAEFELEAGDAVVFYTDGVVEGRSADGRPFGLEGFTAVIEAAVASRATPDVVVRHTINGVLAHQDNRLRDDATMVWVAWGRAA
jgi:serine phosphatase RsbU (regulator of sigma subunit)